MIWTHQQVCRLTPIFGLVRNSSSRLFFFKIFPNHWSTAGLSWAFKQQMAGIISGLMHFMTSITCIEGGRIFILVTVNNLMQMFLFFVFHANLKEGVIPLSYINSLYFSWNFLAYSSRLWLLCIYAFFCYHRETGFSLQDRSNFLKMKTHTVPYLATVRVKVKTSAAGYPFSFCRLLLFFLFELWILKWHVFSGDMTITSS